MSLAATTAAETTDAATELGAGVDGASRSGLAHSSPAANDPAAQQPTIVTPALLLAANEPQDRAQDPGAMKSAASADPSHVHGGFRVIVRGRLERDAWYSLLARVLDEIEAMPEGGGKHDRAA